MNDFLLPPRSPVLLSITPTPFPTPKRAAGVRSLVSVCESGVYMREYIRNDTSNGGFRRRPKRDDEKNLWEWCKGGTVRGRFQVPGCPAPVFRLEWNKHNASVLRELGRQFGIRNIGPLTFTKRFYKNQNTKISRMMSLLQDSHSIPLPTSCTHSKDPGCIASFVQELDLHRSLTSFWAEARCS